MSEFPSRYGDPIELTDEHERLAARLYIRWDDEMEWGGPAVDFKRPFGNSDMPGDVAEILQWDVDEDDGLTVDQYERAHELLYEMGHVLRDALTLWRISRGLV